VSAGAAIRPFTPEERAAHRRRHVVADDDVTMEELLVMRRTTEAGLDPAWVARYGEEAWRAALSIVGGLGAYLEVIGEEED
jgi:hypothetical protein